MTFKSIVWGVLAAGFPLYAATVAYWTFDAGPANTVVPTEQDGYYYSEDIPDVSGNGNHVKVWSDAPNNSSFWFRNNLPFSVVPQTRRMNQFSMQNWGTKPGTLTYSAYSMPSGIDAERIAPAQFTVEAIFNPGNVQDPPGAGEYGTIVNRDAYNICTAEPGAAAFVLRVKMSNLSVEAFFVDVSGYKHVVQSASNAIQGFDYSTDPTGLTGTWYHAAVVSDGITLTLYLTNITEGGETEVAAALDITSSGSPDTTLSTDHDIASTWHGGSWVFYRELVNKVHTNRYQGLIDEVRISDGALGPSHFLCNEVLLLSERLKVESVRSAYLNKNTAMLAFQCFDDDDIRVELTFRDPVTGTSPVSPMQVTVYASQGLQEENIDITNWPDGDYEVRIREVREDGQDTGLLIRGIRKQTIVAPPDPTEPIDVAGRKMLFVDDWYIASQSGLNREVEPCRTIPIEPWKTDPDYFRYHTWVTDFRIGKDQKMYVELYGRNGMSNGAAQDELKYWVVSDDYENWDVAAEPEDRDYGYDMITFDKTKVKNLFLGTPSYRYYDPEEDGPVNLSQVSVYKVKPGLVLGDITIPYWCRIAVWERPNGEYLILTPEPIVRVKGEFEDNEIGQWQDANDNYGPEHLSRDGNTLRFYQTRNIPRNDPLRVYYDNILASRILVAWSSQDGVTWSPAYFEVPDECETFALQHYGVFVFDEEEHALELSYVRMYDQADQKLSADLAYSRDGILWNRFSQQPFLENGEFGSWNFGYSYFPESRTRLDNGREYFEPIFGINVLHFMFLTAYDRKDRSYITTDYYLNRFEGRLAGEGGIPDSEIWDWYGSSWDHIVDATKNMVITPALIKYRKDGWVRLGQATDTGMMTTKILSAGSKLNINAKTDPNGYILVEVLDQYGTDLPEYSGDSGALFAGDSVNSPLRWNDRSITDLPNQPVKLRITIYKGQLYSLNFGGYNNVIYVDADATGQNDGSGWADAFCDLQNALASAEYGDQIWVAEGVYKPTQDVNADLACYEAFELKNGVAVYGGFAGSETALSQRDYKNHETILSGDLAGDDGPNFTNNDENSRHIIIGDDTDAATILDGFTITGGRAGDAASPHNAGGGLIVWTTGSPTLRNCTFTGNSATTYGGAIYAGKSSMKIQSCRFEKNISRSGGAIRLQYSGDVEIDDCIFIENGGSTETIETRYGGAVSNWDADSPVISNSYFIGNQTTLSLTNVGYGGAIMMEPGTTAHIRNCVFNGNKAGRGGAIQLGANQFSDTQSSDIINCTFAGNAAMISGKGISGTSSGTAVVSVRNSILWDGNSEISYNSDLFSVEYSNVYGGWPGEGNVSLLPNFIDPEGADHVAGTEDDDYRLTIPSACIDSGNNAVVPANLLADIDGNNRISNTTVDMGAYEYGSTPFLGVCGDALHPIPPGDLTEDCRVTLEDMVVLAANWLVCTAPACDPIPPGDLTEDCKVNIRDLAVLAENWLACTVPECD